ncbi:subtilisin-like protein [Exidia glandulosa HHB12029]|uniref:tripeptidyl-peptidase II n=1 Tax=Exidia glandulosa HHB12029 TaxID=1314781 RepID=A0A165IQB5_EXIGL|nr:subtilisin-like protein [Exidia glandulosa HHB12029]
MRSLAAFVLLVASLAAVGDASPTPLAKRMVLHDKRSAPPRGFVHVSEAHPDHVLNLRFHLKKSDRDGLQKKLYEVSTPGHPNYGKHLSKAELETYVRPKDETVTSVTAWLKLHGLEPSSYTSAGDVLQVSVPVQKANEMLGAQYHSYVHAQSGRTTTRTMSYSLPADIKEHVSTVDPTTAFMITPDIPSAAIVSRQRYNATSTSSAPSLNKRIDDSCSQEITPTCIQQLYGIPSGSNGGSGKVTLAVGGFIDQYANHADLSTFLGGKRPDLNPQPDFGEVLLENGQNSQDPSQVGGEANLDVQFTVGLVANTAGVTFVSVGNGGDGNGFYNIIKDILAADTVPLVLSTSYGLGEEQMSPDLGNEMCDAYMQLGARGTSIIFSSGDSGVGSGDCTNFMPIFPSGCPYVTSVGATDGIIPETVAGFSSGGFSNIFPVPDFQKDAVQGYLNSLGGTYQGLFNAGGRAFPDVAAQGTKIATVNAGQFGQTGGTSASAPIFASTIAFLNDELLAAGKNPLGWLNPFLYANGGAFNDVTSGSNPGCNTNGFDAAQGWDPATGLGTPNYGALRSAAGL